MSEVMVPVYAGVVYVNLAGGHEDALTRYEVRTENPIVIEDDPARHIREEKSLALTYPKLTRSRGDCGARRPSPEVER